MNEQSPIIGAYRAGKLVVPHNPHDRDRTLYIIVGADIINMLRRVTSTAKALLMEQVYNVKYADSMVERAELPKEKGDYPQFAIKLMVTQRQFFDAKVFTAAQRYRTQFDAENNALITYLGFTPEAAKDPGADSAKEN